eukprot:gene3764-13825_t
MEQREATFDLAKIKPAIPILLNLGNLIELEGDQKTAVDALVSFITSLAVEQSKSSNGEGSTSEDHEMFQDFISSFTTPSVATVSRGNTMVRDRCDLEGMASKSWDAIMHEIMIHRTINRWREYAAKAVEKRTVAVQEHLNCLGEWDTFDCFGLAEASYGRPLQSTGTALFHVLGLFKKLPLSMTKVRQFMEAIETAYAKANPYHNATHASDVVQGIACFLMMEKSIASKLTDLETLALVVAAIVHDVGHPGVTNAFHVTTNSDTSYCYHDNSVNENSHLFVAFKILSDPAYNFLTELPDTDFRYVRRLIINTVLSTDMSFHMGLLKSFPTTISLHGTDIDKWDCEARMQLLKYVLHAVDISNPGRPWERCLQWAKNIGIPVSPLNNKSKANVVKSQQVFCDLFVKPTFQALEPIAPIMAAKVLEHCAINSAKYAELLEKGETLLPGMIKGETPILPGMTRGETPILPGMTNGETLLPGMTKRETPILPGMTKGEMPILPGRTNGETLLPGRTNGETSGPGAINSATNRTKCNDSIEKEEAHLPGVSSTGQPVAQGELLGQGETPLLKKRRLIFLVCPAPGDQWPRVNSYARGRRPFCAINSATNRTKWNDSIEKEEAHLPGVSSTGRPVAQGELLGQGETPLLHWATSCPKYGDLLEKQETFLPDMTKEVTLFPSLSSTGRPVAQTTVTSLTSRSRAFLIRGGHFFLACPAPGDQFTSCPTFGGLVEKLEA